jgi:hypothetical protein
VARGKPPKIARRYFRRLFLGAENKHMSFLAARENQPKIISPYFWQSGEAAKDCLFSTTIPLFLVPDAANG